jgi:Spy/CpxP family protein refolding chaperone
MMIMAKSFFPVLLVLSLLSSGPLLAAEPSAPRPIPEELSETWERLQHALQDWSGRLWERFGSRGTREDRPVISQLLSNREILNLTADQVRKLEQLRDNFQRQAIRSDADLRIVELDIATLLNNEPVDMTKLEQKIRESEKLRTDLRIARIRAVEQARALLTGEQKKKLQELNPSARPSRPPRAGQNPSSTEKEPPSP